MNIKRTLVTILTVMLLASGTAYASPGSDGDSSGRGSGAHTRYGEPSVHADAGAAPVHRVAIGVENLQEIALIGDLAGVEVIHVIGPDKATALVELTTRDLRRRMAELDDTGLVNWITPLAEVENTATAQGALFAWGAILAWGDRQEPPASAYTETREWAPTGPLQSDGDGTIVAVIDTGIDRHHWAFNGTHLLDGFDVLDGGLPDDTGNGIDDDGDGIADAGVGHGTYVASLIAALAPSATLLPIRAIGDEGRATTWDIAIAVEHAVAAGADIVNLSLGTTERDRLLKRLLGDYADAGIIFVGAAGNTGASVPTFPAAEDEVIAVGALEASTRQPASFSASGPWVDLFVTGTDLAGAIPGGGLVSWDGTSAAAAIATGLMAAALGAVPGAGSAELRSMLGAAPEPAD